MKYIPILFSSAMVNAILAGHKNQTRRVSKHQPIEGYLPKLNYDHFGKPFYVNRKDAVMVEDKVYKCPYEVGDVLWVRETLYQNGEFALEYNADSQEINSDIIPNDFNVKIDKHGNYKHCKISSLFMPKWACRIFLKVKSIKIERLQNISENDSIAEGCSLYGPFDEYRGAERNNGGAMKYNAFSKAWSAFKNIWETINSEESWKSNPWFGLLNSKQLKNQKTLNSENYS